MQQCGTDVKPVSHKPSYCSLRHVNSSRLENLQPLLKLRNVSPQPFSHIYAMSDLFMPS